MRMRTNDERIDRRSFLGKSATTVAALGAPAVLMSSAPSTRPPSEKVRLAAIGVGGRCDSLIRGFLARDDCEFVSLCDVYPQRDKVRSAADAIAAKQGKRPPIIQEFRRVLDDKSVDAVIVGTPDHWHAPMAILACQAGKDVYVEKPPTHNIWEGRKLVEAAKRYRRVVQCGTQNRSAPYVLEALGFLRGGGLGDIKICKVFNMKSGGAFRRGPDGDPRKGMDYDTWLGPAEARPYNDRTVYGGGWHKYWDFSGGDMADDGVHQLDIARWLIGKAFPKSVHAYGGKLVFDDDREVPDTQIVHYDFGDLVMTFELTQWAPYMKKTNGPIRRSSSVFPHWPQNATRIELYGSKNMMVLGRHGGVWQAFSGDGKVVAQQYGRFPDPSHKENFISCIKSRKDASANPEAGHRSATLVHLGNIALRVGGELRFRAETETFADNDRANALVKRNYRGKFKVPDVV